MNCEIFWLYDCPFATMIYVCLLLVLIYVVPSTLHELHGLRALDMRRTALEVTK